MALGQETLTHSRRPRLQNSSSGHAKPLIATRVARFLPVLDKSEAKPNRGAKFLRSGQFEPVGAPLSPGKRSPRGAFGNTVDCTPGTKEKERPCVSYLGWLYSYRKP